MQPVITLSPEVVGEINLYNAMMDKIELLDEYKKETAKNFSAVTSQCSEMITTKQAKCDEIQMRISARGTPTPQETKELRMNECIIRGAEKTITKILDHKKGCEMEGEVYRKKGEEAMRRVMDAIINGVKVNRSKFRRNSALFNTSGFMAFRADKERELGIDLKAYRINSDLSIEEVYEQDNELECIQTEEGYDNESETESEMMRDNGANGGSPGRVDYDVPIEVVTQANQNVYAMEREVEEVENEYSNWREGFNHGFAEWRFTHFGPDIMETYSKFYCQKGVELSAKLKEAEKKLEEAKKLAKRVGAPNRDDQSSKFVSDPGDGFEEEDIKYGRQNLDRDQIRAWAMKNADEGYVEANEYQGSSIVDLDNVSVGSSKNIRSVGAVSVLGDNKCSNKISSVSRKVSRRWERSCQQFPELTTFLLKGNQAWRKEFPSYPEDVPQFVTVLNPALAASPPSEVGGTSSTPAGPNSTDDLHDSAIDLLDDSESSIETKDLPPAPPSTPESSPQRKRARENYDSDSEAEQEGPASKKSRKV